MLSSVAVSAARVIVSAMCVAVSAPGGVIVHDVVSLWGRTYTYQLMGKVLDQINQWPSILLAVCG